MTKQPARTSLKKQNSPAKMKVKFDSNVRIKNENDLLLKTDKDVLTDKEEILHIKTEDAKANAVTIKENHIDSTEFDQDAKTELLNHIDNMPRRQEMLIAIPVIKEWLEVMPPTLVPHHATDAESVLVGKELEMFFNTFVEVPSLDELIGKQRVAMDEESLLLGEALEIFFNGPADKASVNCRSSLQDLEEIFDIFLTSSNSVPQEDEISLELASVTAAPQWKQEERIASIWGSNNTKEDKRPLQQPDFKRMPTGGEIMESIINPSSTARILQACGVSKKYIDAVCGPEWRDVSMIQ